jgi:hypothetical protein
VLRDLECRVDSRGHSATQVHDITQISSPDVGHGLLAPVYRNMFFSRNAEKGFLSKFLPLEIFRRCAMKTFWRKVSSIKQPQMSQHRFPHCRCPIPRESDATGVIMFMREHAPLTIDAAEVYANAKDADAKRHVLFRLPDEWVRQNTYHDAELTQ